MIMLCEGGHAVKNVVRINQENVEDTLKSLQSDILDELGLKLPDTAKTLGSTGKRNAGGSSGDIDVAVSIEDIQDKNNLHSEQEVAEFIKKVSLKITQDVTVNKGTGIVSISYPITNTDGKQEDQFVQVDFMLTPKENMDMVGFGYHSPHQNASKYKGAYRGTALMMVAAAVKYKPLEKVKTESGEDLVTVWERYILDPKRGLVKAKQTLLSPKTGKISKTKTTLSRELVTNNKENIISLILGKDATEQDADSFESIINYIKSDKFPHPDKRDDILKSIKREVSKFPDGVPDELKDVTEETMSEAGKTNALQGVTHLEFLEDLVFNQGSDGLELAIDTIEKFVDDLSQEGNVDTQTFTSMKYDGAPSLYYGTDPDGKFFVSTKAIFNKGSNQKLGYGLQDIKNKWDGEIANILYSAYSTLKNTVTKPGLVMNGDLLFSSADQKKKMDIEGQRVIGFQPNTILYTVPIDKKSDVYNRVVKASLGIAIHGAFESSFEDGGRISLNRLSTEDIISEVESIKNPSVFAIHPFIPRIDLKKSVGANVEELNMIIDETKKTLDNIDPEFDDAWKTGSNPILKNLKTRMQSFAKDEAVKEDKNTIYNENFINSFTKRFKSNLVTYLEKTFEKEGSKLSTSVGKEKKMRFLDEIKDWINDSDETFDPFIHSYFYMLNIKKLLLGAFGKIQSQLGKEFLIDKKKDGFIATKPEGYVLLNGNNMIKIVDRIEFSKNNLLYSPFHENKEISIHMNKKNKSVSDEIFEDIVDKLSAMESIYGGFADEEMVEAAEKYGTMDAIYVGRFQPPTIAHSKNIADLSKLFRKVYVLISESKNKTKKYLQKNPLTVEERIEILESDSDIRNLKNVDMKGGPTSIVFGLPHPDSVSELRKLFKEPEDRNMVLAIGKEDDRYFAMKDRGNMFVVNDSEYPSEEKSFGLYGIELQKFPGVEEKVSATTAREAILNNDDETAKKVMAGSDEKLDEIIPILRERLSSLNEEEYINIEGFNVDAEIIKSIEEEYEVNQMDAMDMIIDILKAGE